MIPIRIATLIACHNRREKTLDCLHALFAATCPECVGLEVHLVDDGSTDGTGAAVADAFPAVRILQGDGSLYWGGGMRLAWDSARATTPDAYLWLNDDTMLFSDGLMRMVETWEGLRTSSPACAVVGATRALDSETTTYGGFRLIRRWGRPRYEMVPVPPGGPAPCDTMNGNCVLISREATELAGDLDPHFPHGMGDFDYGHRLRRVGVPVLVSPGWVGTCPRNAVTGTWRDSSLSFRRRWAKLLSIKGLPPRAWFRYCFRHLGWYAPIGFLAPYARLVIDSFQRSPRS